MFLQAEQVKRKENKLKLQQEKNQQIYDRFGIKPASHAPKVEEEEIIPGSFDTNETEYDYEDEEYDINSENYSYNQKKYQQDRAISTKEIRIDDEGLCPPELRDPSNWRNIDENLNISKESGVYLQKNNKSYSKNTIDERDENSNILNEKNEIVGARIIKDERGVFNYIPNQEQIAAQQKEMENNFFGLFL